MKGRFSYCQSYWAKSHTTRALIYCNNCRYFLCKSRIFDSFELFWLSDIPYKLEHKSYQSINSHFSDEIISKGYMDRIEAFEIAQEFSTEEYCVLNILFENRSDLTMARKQYVRIRKKQNLIRARRLRNPIIILGSKYYIEISLKRFFSMKVPRFEQKKARIFELLKIHKIFHICFPVNLEYGRMKLFFNMLKKIFLYLLMFRLIYLTIAHGKRRYFKRYIFKYIKNRILQKRTLLQVNFSTLSHRS